MALPISGTCTCYCDKSPHTICNYNWISLLRIYTFGCHYFCSLTFLFAFKKKKPVFYLLTTDWYIVILKKFKQFLLNLTKKNHSGLIFYNKYQPFALNQLSKSEEEFKGKWNSF